jgi:hypothetical protein
MPTISYRLLYLTHTIRNCTPYAAKHWHSGTASGAVLGVSLPGYKFAYSFMSFDRLVLHATCHQLCMMGRIRYPQQEEPVKKCSSQPPSRWVLINTKRKRPDC